MIKLFAPFFLILSVFTANAQEKTFKDKTQVLQFSKKNAELFKEKKIHESFKEMIPYWPLPANEIEGLEEKTIKYLNIVEDRFGKIIGAQKLKEETIADIGIRETYLIRYEKNAIRLIFTYYKNDKGWILNAFLWDDSFSLEFK